MQKTKTTLRNLPSCHPKEERKKLKMDFNKLITDIIKAAREETCLNADNSEPLIEFAKLTTTLKLEVKVSKAISQPMNEVSKNSTKLVLLTINDY